MRTAVAFLALVAGLAFPPSSLAQTTEQTLYASVLDKSGRPVGGLDAADFVVFGAMLGSAAGRWGWRARCW